MFGTVSEVQAVTEAEIVALARLLVRSERAIAEFRAHLGLEPGPVALVVEPQGGHVDSFA